MDYAIKCHLSGKYVRRIHVHKWYSVEEKLATRWKTQKAAEDNKQKMLEHFELLASYGYCWYTTLKPEDYEIVQLESLPKVNKPKPDKDIRTKIAKQLIKHGWCPNQQFQHWNPLDDLGFDKHSLGYLIDSNKRFAISLKPNVLNVHDGSRKFCKVVSMLYNEITIQPHEIVCGCIAVKL